METKKWLKDLTTPNMYMVIYKRIIDSTGMETWLVCFCMPVTAKKFKSCLPLLEME